jgi:formate dehydrogenase subunit gamma
LFFASSYDKIWVRRKGGYLGHKGEVSAGRFNAGQKMFYWYTTVFSLIISVSGVVLIFKFSFPLSWICVTSTVHNLFAFILLAGVFSHAYLGTVANPGTWRVLVDGYVSKIWAEHHHPNWFRMLIDRGIITDDYADLSRRTKDLDDQPGTDEESDDPRSH